MSDTTHAEAMRYRYLEANHLRECTECGHAVPESEYNREYGICQICYNESGMESFGFDTILHRSTPMHLHVEGTYTPAIGKFPSEFNFKLVMCGLKNMLMGDDRLMQTEREIIRCEAVKRWEDALKAEARK